VPAPPAGQPQYTQPAYGGPQYVDPQYGQPPYAAGPGYIPTGYGTPQPPKKSHMGLIAAIVAAVLVLGGGGFCTYWFAIRDDDKSTSASDRSIKSDDDEDIDDEDIDDEEDADDEDVDENEDVDEDQDADEDEDVREDEDEDADEDQDADDDSLKVLVDGDFDPAPFCATMYDPNLANLDTSQADLLAEALDSLLETAPEEIKGDIETLRDFTLAVVALDAGDYQRAAELEVALMDVDVDAALLRIATTTEELCV
jgi:hypothetical protein